jgi:hypothetical protein
MPYVPFSRSQINERKFWRGSPGTPSNFAVLSDRSRRRISIDARMPKRAEPGAHRILLALPEPDFAERWSGAFIAEAHVRGSSASLSRTRPCRCRPVMVGLTDG